jgi:hypothetical protein
VLRGAMLMCQFLQGIKATTTIAWLDKNETKNNELSVLPTKGTIFLLCLRYTFPIFILGSLTSYGTYKNYDFLKTSISRLFGQFTCMLRKSTSRG